jgi:hypothetical protein
MLIFPVTAAFNFTDPRSMEPEVPVEIPKGYVVAPLMV